MGYYLAGFDVIGVDIQPQPRYPFSFIRRDALAVLTDDTLLSEFDAIHASPPPYERGSTLRLLGELFDIAWITEDPTGTLLCGKHFGVDGHRRYRTTFPLPPAGCACPDQTRAAEAFDYTRWVGENLLSHLHQVAFARDHLRARIGAVARL